METKDDYVYIVYCTTNLVNNYIYIGVHKTLDPFKFDGYIGCGVYVTQPASYQYPKTRFQHAVKEFGPKNFRREVLSIFKTAEEAYAEEAILVDEKFLKRPDVYNMILGGDSRDSIQCYKVPVHQYTLEGDYVTSYESIKHAALKMNKDHSLIWHAAYDKVTGAGYLWSTDKMDKLDITQYNLGINQRFKVYVYLETGEFYKEFNSGAECRKELSVYKISECYRLGVKSKGYYLSTVKAETYDIARHKYLQERVVHMYDSNGDYVKTYEHQIDAQNEFPKANINKCIKLRQADINGNYWTLDKLDNIILKPNGRCTKRKVGKYDLEDNLVTVYETATQAANENGTAVWKVLAGTNQTQKGHIYRYLT